MTPDDPWPHLLVSQDSIFRKSLRLANLAAVSVSISARLLEAKFYADQPDGARARAAHCHIYFIIQNQNFNSKGHGDYYWFGVPVYDTRYLYSPAYAAQDTGGEKKPGTGKYIYRPDARRITNQTVHSGDWVRIEVDILPFILEGLEDAWAKGYLQDSKDLNDYGIAGLNVGWEVWGLVDVSIQLKDFSVQAVYYEE